MPVIRYACPPDKPTQGQNFPPVYCITKCKHQCLSPYLMAAIHSSNQRNHHKGRYISATALSGCVRRLKLERTVDYAEYYKNLYYGFRGTVTHQVIEDASIVDLGEGRTLLDYGFLSEWRMQVGFCFTHGAFPIQGDVDPTGEYTLPCPTCAVPVEEQETFILGGTLDGAQALWDEFDEETGILPCNLFDIKTMQEYAVGYMIKGDPKNTLHPQIKDAYVVQARIYAFLASHSIPPKEFADRGVRQLIMRESHIQGFAMGEAPWTGGGTYRWKDHYRNPKKDWPMHPVDLDTPEWTENFIKENARAIYDSLILNETRGDVCEPEDNKGDLHSWMCGFCAFYGTEDCPNPALEHRLIQLGKSKEEAFAEALATPVIIEEEQIGKLTEKDTANMRAFFNNRKKRNEPETNPGDGSV
jgi:hypothetical protein